MKRIAGWSMVAAVVLADGATAQSTAYVRANAKTNIAVEMSMNPAFVAELGYDRRIADVAGKIARVHATLGLPVFLAREMDSFQLGLGSSVKWVDAGRLGLVGGVFTSVATSDNENGKLVAWRMKLSVSPGYYRERWFAALAFAWHPTIATHITHSSYAKAAFDDRYPAGTAPTAGIRGPKDGWFRAPASSVTAGVVAGRALGRATTVYMDGGISRAPSSVGISMFGDIGVIPYYLSVGVVRQLDRLR